MSNAKIAEYLAKDYPGFNPSGNLLCETLTAAEKAAIASMLRQWGTTLDLANLKSLSKIKLALKARLEAAVNSYEFSGKISFSDDAVTVNDKTYPVQNENGYRRIHVGKAKLNVEALKQLLGQPG